MKNQAQFITLCVGSIIFVLFLYTRFVNLSWGLPYPLHPDERNMAVAIEQLSCKSSDGRVERVMQQSENLSTFTVFDQLRFTVRSWISDCLYPNFFAYGQFPLYFAYAGIIVAKLVTGTFGTPVQFSEAVVALRLLSAVFSLGTVFFIIEIVRHVVPSFSIISRNSPKKPEQVSRLTDNSADKEVPRDTIRQEIPWFGLHVFFIPALVTLFNPGLIQFAHFGTTESMLMFWYTGLVYLSIRLIQKRIWLQSFVFLAGVLSGGALATKITGLSFLIIPVTAVFLHYLLHFPQVKKPYLFLRFISSVLVVSVMAAGIAAVLSPYNILAYDDFISSMRFESDVALGTYVAFYTRQFEQTIPVLFQTVYTFPYAFGLVPFLFFILGFIFLSWKRTDINFLRFAFLVYAIPQVILFAKWSRFIAPVFPVMIIIISLAVLMAFSYFWVSWRRHATYLQRITHLPRSVLRYVAATGVYLVILFSVLPGMAYLSVYMTRDVRFVASDWIYQRIPEGSRILSETANVVDIPIHDSSSNVEPRTYQYTSFNFYDLDLNSGLQQQLQEEISQADYIFVPSRRVYANHTCARPDDYQIGFLHEMVDSVFPRYRNAVCAYRQRAYPRLHAYYSDLFSGKLGFEHVSTFSSYPRIGSFISFPDEDAEETWTVFDHPVIRIYKKTDL